PSDSRAFLADILGSAESCKAPPAIASARPPGSPSPYRLECEGMGVGCVFDGNQEWRRELIARPQLLRKSRRSVPSACRTALRAVAGAAPLGQPAADAVPPAASHPGCGLDHCRSKSLAGRDSRRRDLCRSRTRGLSPNPPTPPISRRDSRSTPVDRAAPLAPS